MSRAKPLAAATVGDDVGEATGVAGGDVVNADGRGACVPHAAKISVRATHAVDRRMLAIMLTGGHTRKTELARAGLAAAAASRDAAYRPVTRNAASPATVITAALIWTR